MEKETSLIIEEKTRESTRYGYIPSISIRLHFVLKPEEIEDNKEPDEQGLAIQDDASGIRLESRQVQHHSIMERKVESEIASTRNGRFIFKNCI